MHLKLVPLPIPSQISHTLFDIVSLSVDAILCHDQETIIIRQYALVLCTLHTFSLTYKLLIVRSGPRPLVIITK